MRTVSPGIGIVETAMPEVKEIRPSRTRDKRGFFSEIFREEVLAQHGIADRFVQENLSCSRRGVVRGLHFQKPPMAQSKLVSVIAGSILDVAVDIRIGSPTYGRHVAVVLSAARGNQLFVPEGFAHGFCALAQNCVVIYKVSRYWSRDDDLGLRWNDPVLGIDWPVSQKDAMLSLKDSEQPTLADLPPYFRYEQRAAE